MTPAPIVCAHMFGHAHSHVFAHTVPSGTLTSWIWVTEVLSECYLYYVSMCHDAASGVGDYCVFVL